VGQDGPLQASLHALPRQSRGLSFLAAVNRGGENDPKRIAEDPGVHLNTVTVINLRRHPIQARLAADRVEL
jgi:hypothetical protein